ncbi:MAG: hypothetical protein AMJ92_09475 [candidate division Zixibacteria bacterium SM23_81]|nr:MAG: hypothetical protein AMJ92_09475 [candidate division Zixibacteria bacterium SM23_81]
MKVAEARKIAKKIGLKVSSKTLKGDLIRQIQRAEGNFDCFGTATDYCDQLRCWWREDCLGKR